MGSEMCIRDSNDINLALDQFGRDLGGALGATLRPAILDRDSTTLDPAEFAQPLHEGGDPLALGCRRGRAQVPDGRQPRWLLRACRVPLQRRRVRLRILVVRCSLPCDPSGWGSFMQ